MVLALCSALGSAFFSLGSFTPGGYTPNVDLYHSLYFLTKSLLSKHESVLTANFLKISFNSLTDKRSTLILS